MPPDRVHTTLVLYCAVCICRDGTWYEYVYSTRVVYIWIVYAEYFHCCVGRPSCAAAAFLFHPLTRWPWAINTTYLVRVYQPVCLMRGECACEHKENQASGRQSHSAQPVVGLRLGLCTNVKYRCHHSTYHRRVCCSILIFQIELKQLAAALKNATFTFCYFLLRDDSFSTPWHRPTTRWPVVLFHPPTML